MYAEQILASPFPFLDFPFLPFPLPLLDPLDDGLRDDCLDDDPLDDDLQVDLLVLDESLEDGSLPLPLPLRFFFPELLPRLSSGWS